MSRSLSFKRSWLLGSAVMLATLGVTLVVRAPRVTAAHAFLTPQAPFITLDATAPVGSTVQAIISSGETYHDFLFEGLPDGIGLAPGPNAETVNVFVAHEQTTVPFFGSRDFQDASVSRLTLRTSDGAVVGASVAIPPTAGFLRFCSASMAGPAEGFRSYTFFTGEESNDIVDVAPGATFGPDRALAPQRQAGYAVALDVDTGNYTHVPGLGRLNHENTIALPGYRRRVLLTTDDTFDGPSAQLYMYIAARESHVTEDRGGLWAFQVTRTEDGPVDPNDPFNGANDYLDLKPGDEFQGQFIRVPRKIARGETRSAPQAALEQWSNERNVFQFIRLEDLAYDKNDPRIVYLADTGRNRVIPDPATGRLVRGPSGTVGFADNGRIFKLVFNRKNPRKVDSFSILADGDSTGPERVPFVSPDNVDTSAHSVMVQEDTSNARIWRYDLASGTWSVVAHVNDPAGESSGIVDASRWFGPGSWLLDVQGHGANVAEELVDGITLKRESGQVIVMTVPGS